MFCACQFKEFPELTAKMLELGANPNRVYQQGSCFITLVRLSTECRETTRLAFELLMRHDFDMELLTTDDFKFLGEEYLEQVLLTH